MNRIRLAFHRLFDRPAPTAPMRFPTRRIGGGVLLDLEDYFEHVITSIADDPKVLDLFMQLVEDRGIAREHVGWEPEKLLMEQLAMRVGYEIPVRGQALARLAKRLKAAVPKASAAAIPAQARRAS